MFKQRLKNKQTKKQTNKQTNKQTKQNKNKNDRLPPNFEVCYASIRIFSGLKRGS